MVPLYSAGMQRKGVGADRERMIQILHFVTFTYENFTTISGVILIAELAVLGVIEWKRRKLKREEAEAKKNQERRKREKPGWYGMEAERLYYRARYSESTKEQKCA